MSIESKIQQSISLAPLTTFKIGGPAKFFVEASAPEDVVEAVSWAKSKNEKYCILGGGSNLLVSDKGYDGLVIKNNCVAIEWQDSEAKIETGVTLAKVVMDAAEKGLTGLEWAAGIPGTVGGAVRGNAGAYGSSIQHNIKTVSVLDSETNTVRDYSPDECRFAYRHSIFKEKKLIALSVIIKLQTGNTEEIRKTMSGFLSGRANSNPKESNAGSVFKNFNFSNLKEANPELAAEAEKDNIMRGGRVSSGWIISRLGLKGKRIGGAMITYEHGNFIVNTGGATAEDVLVLMSLVKQKVRVEFKLQLENEIEYLDY
jgi:UDP-N-acetylmuramate dehydrogenase